MNGQIELLKQRKRELGYTNKDIAALTNIPLQTIEKIFAGITKAPRIDTIQTIEKALGLSDENAVTQKVSPNAIIVDDEEEKDLIMCFRSITREAKDVIMFNVHTAVIAYKNDKKEN